MKKNINKKGFTLVELLAVVVILLAISVIAISSISAAIERQNDKKDNAIKSIIINYAKMYYDDFKNSISGTTCVNVDVLVSTYKLDVNTLLDSKGKSLNEGSVDLSTFTYSDYQCQ